MPFPRGPSYGCWAGAREVANACWGAAKMRLAAPELFEATSLLPAGAIASGFTPQALANTAWVLHPASRDFFRFIRWNSFRDAWAQKSLYTFEKLGPWILCFFQKNMEKYLSVGKQAFASTGVEAPLLFGAFPASCDQVRELRILHGFDESG